VKAWLDTDCDGVTVRDVALPKAVMKAVVPLAYTIVPPTMKDVNVVPLPVTMFVV
jgi:hypothetical protein